MSRRSRQPEAPRLVVIDGPLGAGKNPLIRKWSERTGARPVELSIESNPFLMDALGGSGPRSFSAQMYFLLARHRQQAELRQGDLLAGRLVCDGIFHKDRVYAEALLSVPEFDLYQRIFRLLEPQAVVPDLIVALKVRPQQLMDRLRARGLARERAIGLALLERICSSFRELYEGWSRSPVVFVDVGEADLNERDDLLDPIVREIRRQAVELAPGEHAEIGPIVGT